MRGTTRYARGLIRYGRLMALGIQAVAFAASGLLAFGLRFDLQIPPGQMQHLRWALAVWLVIKCGTFVIAGLDRGWWRYVSLHDLVRLGAANLLASTASALTIQGFIPSGFPRSIYVIDLLLTFLLTAGLRIVVRVVSELTPSTGKQVDRVLIYGAGSAGQALLREVRLNPALHYEVVGFLDDDPRKAGHRLQGVTVSGGGNQLAGIAASRGITLVLIAIPSATGREMTRILGLCDQARIRFKTVPGLSEVIQGAGLARQIRPVALEDLLGRSAVRLEEQAIRDKLEHRTVLVTGAAGSIGSELCRQIARFQPGTIVALDASETGLFQLDQDMHESYPETPVTIEIGSIRDRRRLDEIMRLHRPSVVYHAAAYKHVPLMESHLFEAVENNIAGTWNVAGAAAAAGVADFVMISSDKAVQPTSFMGATKRVAELIIRSMQNAETRFVSVRFGNVLGSNGSVVPLFQRQIAQGGPVRVTHPEMRRFFMTIPEAAQLVLQASTMGKGGEIFVLDMGQPVRIVDLARNLILLSGLRPEDDIRIEFTGVRPGEKLYEELNLSDESTLPTYHEKIKIFSGQKLSSAHVSQIVDEVTTYARERDIGNLLLAIKEIVPDYNPGAHLLRRMMEAQVQSGFTVSVAQLATAIEREQPAGIPMEMAAGD